MVEWLHKKTHSTTRKSDKTEIIDKKRETELEREGDL